MGIVYVLSNESLHGVCKVGFTLNSVRERLSQLNSSTSIPTKFVAEYYVELEDADTYRIEQATHAELERLGFHHGKEYFKCSVSDCKNAIVKSIAAHSVLVLNAEDAEVTREKVARENQRIAAERARQARIAEQERELTKAEAEVRRRYEASLSFKSDPGDFIPWWVGCSVVVALGISAIAPRARDGGVFLLSIFIGLITAFFAREWARGNKQKSAAYVAEVAARERAIAEIRNAQVSRTSDAVSTPMHAYPIPAQVRYPKILMRSDRAVHGRVDYPEYSLQVPIDDPAPPVSQETLRKLTAHVARKNADGIARLVSENDHAARLASTSRTLSSPASTDQDTGAEEEAEQVDIDRVCEPPKPIRPPVPFSVGTKVTHKMKGAAYGTGVILDRNGQHLVVEFPAVHKTMPMMTDTASKYLLPVDDLENPQSMVDNALNIYESVSQLVAAASKTAVSKLSLETQVETWLDLGRSEKAHPEYLAALSKALPLIKRAPSLEAAVVAVQRALG